MLKIKLGKCDFFCSKFFKRKCSNQNLIYWYVFVFKFVLVTTNKHLHKTICMQYNVAMIGLGTMGRNLVLNMADKGFSVIGFDKNSTTANLLLQEASPQHTIALATSLQELCVQLATPRKIILLVPAGKIVDAVLEELIPFLEKDDIVIDSGNSYYKDTQQRIAYMLGKGFHFVGMGISGGENGARFGPSIMPGGDEVAYQNLQPLLQAISAQVNNQPCVAYMGNGAAGHYVKMVHNGIEYAIMQLISEMYAVLKNVAGCSNNQLHQIFAQWNTTHQKSFLLEITAAIFLQKDELSNDDLIDVIADKAGSKGTGKWTSQEAMDLPISIPTIDMAVAMRDLSVYKNERIKAAALYAKPNPTTTIELEEIVAIAGKALHAATIVCYAQGLAMLQKASTQLQMNIPLADVVKIWRGGCIIRAEVLNELYTILTTNPNLENILLHETIAQTITTNDEALRSFVTMAIQNKIACTAFASTIGYVDALATENMPVNLIQAQRDFFGAHTYERIDKPGSFHTNWQD
jgi:6-phosphogluconate dehydrogenase